ncbi:MAG: hypothetical protein ACLQDQ_03375 [Myxococcaceae bacterium]
MNGPGIEPIAAAPPLLLLGLAAYLVAVAGTALTGLAAGLRRAGIAEERRLRIGRLAGAGLAAWFLLLAMTAVSGLYLEEPARPRFLWYLVPAFLVVVVLFRARWLRTAVRAMPTWWIPAFQTFRLGGGLTLFAAWAVGLTPWGLARTGGSFDLLVGAAAAAVALALARGVNGSLGMGLLWNGLGLGDILHTLFRAVASAPGPQRLFFDEPANRIAAVFPFIYLPGFIVPLTVLLHLLSLRQLLSTGVRR